MNKIMTPTWLESPSVSLTLVAIVVLLYEKLDIAPANKDTLITGTE